MTSDMVRLAAYQGRCVNGDPDANLATVQRVLAEAAERGADFLCFPETFLSGYGDRATVEQGALSLDDARLADLARQAHRHEVVLLVGLAERLSSGRIGNTVLILCGGEQLGLYRKTMLTGSDAREMGFCRDYDLPVFYAKGLTFGCIICADSSYFETAATMAYKGASVLFSPHYNMIGAAGMDDHRIRVRNNHAGLAALLDMYVVRANVIVDDRPGRLGYGDTAIFDPRGYPIAEAGLFREALIVAEVQIPSARAAGISALRDRVPQAVRDQLAAAILAYQADSS